MRLDLLLVSLATATLAATPPNAPHGLHRPQSPKRDIAQRDEAKAILSPPESVNDLVKRKGGGGGGGRGGGGGGGGRSSGSGGSSGSSRSSPSSNQGGRTTTGTGPRPAYGGGRFYGGGATVPYKSGTPSPSGILPVFAAAAFIAFWPGLWLYGAYLYHWPHDYTFFNETSGEEESKPVTCACDPYLVCGCDYTDDEGYMSDLIGNGSWAALDHAVITVAEVNGTVTILINGTLPNGTTAAGGDEEPFSDGAAGMRGMLVHLGWWPVFAAVAAIVLTA